MEVHLDRRNRVQHDNRVSRTSLGRPVLVWRGAGTRATQAPTLGCLVVSCDPLRQMMFGQTAQRTGWRPLVCGDVPEALQHLATSIIGAALVDIATPAADAVQRMRQLVERLAENKDVLTVVCGRTNDRMAEIWARELGVWAHLPGVAPESDLDSLLRAARQVVERMHQRREAAASAGTSRFSAGY